MPPPAAKINLTRLAWLVSIATPVLLLALLGIAKAASGAETSVPAPVPSVEPAYEEECEETGEGEFECEAEEGEEVEEGAFPPEECMLQSAQARVVSRPARNRLQFVVHYTTIEPTRGYLDFELRGRGGSLNLGIVKRRLGRSGVVRLTETLGDGEMQRALAADGFLFTLDIPSAPSYCRPYFTQQLSVKRTGHGQTAWSEAPTSASSR
jgi:hypothetical protein